MLRIAYRPHLSQLLVLASVVALLLGCCPKQFERPDLALVTEASEPSVKQMGEGLLRRVIAYAKKTDSMAYTTRMEHYGARGVLKGKVDVLGKRPAQFRFEALSPSDDTVALLISDGERFMSHQRGQPVCYVGKACAENVSRLVPLPFEGETLFNLLVGGVPLLESAKPSGRWDSCQGVYELVLTRGELTQTTWIRPDVFAPVRVVLQRGEREVFRIEYEDFTVADDVLQAHAIRYTSESHDIDLTMTIRDTERNGLDDSPTLFRPECPMGTERRELLCQ